MNVVSQVCLNVGCSKGCVHTQGQQSAVGGVLVKVLSSSEDVRVDAPSVCYVCMMERFSLEKYI